MWHESHVQHQTTCKDFSRLSLQDGCHNPGWTGCVCFSLQTFQRKWESRLPQPVSPTTLSVLPECVASRDGGKQTTSEWRDNWHHRVSDKTTLSVLWTQKVISATEKLSRIKDKFSLSACTDKSLEHITISFDGKITNSKLVIFKRFVQFYDLEPPVISEKKQ